LYNYPSLFPLLELELSVFRRIWLLIRSIMTPIRVLILEFSLSPDASWPPAVAGLAELADERVLLARIACRIESTDELLGLVVVDGGVLTIREWMRMPGVEAASVVAVLERVRVEEAGPPLDGSLDAELDSAGLGAPMCGDEVDVDVGFLLK
jgi:hypothetical protein